MKKILIIDDEESILNALKLYLKQFFIVKTETNPKKTIPLLNLFLPDLLIIDLKFPHNNGLNIIESIKEIDKFKNLPIILISAFGIGENKNKENFYTYISKPFSLEYIKNQIEALISKK